MINEPEKYLCYLEVLGQKHVLYEAEPELMELVACKMLESINDILKAEVHMVAHSKKELRA